MHDILKQIKRGSSESTHRILLAAPEGVGKTTFASKAPNPLFICAEDGMVGFEHLQRFVPTGLDDLHNLLDALVASIDFKTVVIDTTDWLERLICSSVCKRDGMADIEAYGYGKGYVVLENELVKLLQKLDILRSKGLWIILLSHVQIKAFNDPTGTTYDRFEMKGQKRFTGILREWPDACLFSVREVFKAKVKGTRAEKAIGGDRVMHTEWSPAWDAKNRLNLPESIPMEWEDFAKAVADNSNAALCAQIRKLHASAKIPETDVPRWTKALASLETMTADKLKAAIEKLKALQ
jgi:hypothetical protein